MNSTLFVKGAKCSTHSETSVSLCSTPLFSSTTSTTTCIRIPRRVYRSLSSFFDPQMTNVTSGFCIFWTARYSCSSLTTTRASLHYRYHLPRVHTPTLYPKNTPYVCTWAYYLLARAHVLNYQATRTYLLVLCSGSEVLTAYVRRRSSGYARPKAKYQKWA